MSHSTTDKKEHILEITVRDLRAIKEATIYLDGITVVSGINGSGKSTLSKVLYYFFKQNNITEAEYNRMLKSYIKRLEKLLSILQFKNKGWLLFRFVLDSPITSSRKLKQAIKGVARNYKKELEIEFRRKRVAEFLKQELKIDLSKVPDNKSTVTYVKEELIKKINFLEQARTNNKYLWINGLKRRIPEFDKNTLFISEYNEKLLTEENISLPFTITKAIYIDTPQIINNFRNHEVEYWEDLIRLLRKSNKNFFAYEIDKLIKNTISGELELEKNAEIFLYKRSDNQTFNLFECATGIKSFSILYLLLNNGHLDKNTLIIIDEPEVHLHPQWIVEYARVIVALHKQLGVKFFIASHSPDMISAIKYISLKEQIADNLNFYLARPSEKDRFKFIYHHLGLDIEPIFEEFNVAIDKIDQYGQTDIE